MQVVEFGKKGGENLNGRPVYRVIRCFHCIITVFTGETIDVAAVCNPGFAYPARASLHPE